MLLFCPTHNLTATVTPKYVSSTIIPDRTTFVPISRKTKYNNLLYLRECLTMILPLILYNTDDGNHGLWGVLSSYAAYKFQQNETLTPPTRPSLYLTIPDDATSVFRSRSETAQKSLWQYFRLHEAYICRCRTFIIDTTKYTWIH